jgi:hypothetical protein
MRFIDIKEKKKIKEGKIPKKVELGFKKTKSDNF